MKKSIFRILLIINYPLLIINYSSAQDPSRLRISLLTCSPGEELYSTFGHSAYRVVDSNSLTDIVYNYGTFNFDDEGFYLKFIRGKLAYYVSIENFADFKKGYQSDNRGIIEQVLNLSPPEKLSIRNFLTENLKEENKYYKYDFFLDNCTTRLRDILEKYHDSDRGVKPVMPAGSRFRNAIHEYLNKNGKQWSKLGIDILLGQPCDAVMTTRQMQFLPENLMKSLDSSNTNHQLILLKQDLYPFQALNEKNPLFTPFVVFSILLLTIVAMGFIRHNFARAFLYGFDGLLFFLTGALGILLILMWTCTDHSMCKNNFNLLWAWPTHFIMAFFVHRKKQWVKKYFLVTAILLALVLLSWSFLPQQMNPGLIPIVLIIVYRSILNSLSTP